MYAPDLTMFPYKGIETQARILVPSSICDVSIDPSHWSAGEDLRQLLYTSQELFFRAPTGTLGTSYVGTFRCVKIGFYSADGFQLGLDDYVSLS